MIGHAAVVPLGRAALAGIALFAVCGFGLVRLTLPEALRRWEALWVLPAGACACGLELFALGLLHLPFRLDLGLVLAAGALAGVIALRRRPVVGARAGARRLAWPAWIALLIVAVALIPLFRAGFATVEGQGQDAHLAVGTAILLQHHPPLSEADGEPVDKVPLVWRSKQSIYYALGANASLAGLDVYQTISTTAALLLALACLGLFLLAVEVLGAPVWAGLVAMGLVGLDRMVLHTVMHPYFNQTWGFMAMPFCFVGLWALARAPSWRAAGLVAAFGATVVFAYPLAAPILALPVLVWAWPRRRSLSPRRGWRALRARAGRGPAVAVAVVVGLFALVPLRGALEKISSAEKVIFSRDGLVTWGGDLTTWFPEPHFLGLSSYGALVVAVPLLAWTGWLALRDRPREVRLGVLGLMAFGVLFAAYFRTRDHGWYFHFKTLAFIAPIALTVAAAGLPRTPRRWMGIVLAVALLLSAAASASRELSSTFDELPRSTLALRSIDAALPPGRSIRLDVSPQDQNWVAFMLHGQPLCSQRPLLHTDYPHVPVARKADDILTPAGARPPADSVGPPLMRLERWTLWRQRPSVPGPSACSQKMVQTVQQVTD